MKDKTRDGLMRITRTPSGQAPASIREKWIGVEMPFSHLAKPEHLNGVMNGAAVESHNGFIVDQQAALDALEKKCPEAAEWWKSMGFPMPFAEFHFDADCAEIVE